MSPSTPRTPRTCRPGGVTGTASSSAPGGPTSRRRVSSRSQVHTSRPSAVQAGTPGTISSQRGSVSSRSTSAWPVPASTVSSRIVRWSRLCTTTSGSCSPVPAGGHQVGERGVVDLDVHGGAVQPGQQEGHLGVRGARGRIGHLGGRPLRVGGVGDVPPGDGRLVHPRDQQRRAVRGPPVAAVAVHLLGRDELRQPERHAAARPAGRPGPGLRRGRPGWPPAAPRRRRRPAASRPGRGADPAPGRAPAPRAGPASGRVRSTA